MVVVVEGGHRLDSNSCWIYGATNVGGIINKRAGTTARHMILPIKRPFRQMWLCQRVTQRNPPAPVVLDVTSVLPVFITRAIPDWSAKSTPAALKRP